MWFNHIMAHSDSSLFWFRESFPLAAGCFELLPPFFLNSSNRSLAFGKLCAV